MRTYVKIEGENVQPIIQKLARIAVNMPEICVWDSNLLDMGWSPATESEELIHDRQGSVAEYFGIEKDVFEKNCDKIIVSSTVDLKDNNLYFEWTKSPTKEQLNKLANMIDQIIKSYGNKYTITNK